MIKFQTTSAGYWQVTSTAAEMYLLEHFPAIVKVAEKKVVKLVRPVEIFIPKEKSIETKKDPFETFKPI